MYRYSSRHQSPRTPPSEYLILPVSPSTGRTMSTHLLTRFPPAPCSWGADCPACRRPPAFPHPAWCPPTGPGSWRPPVLTVTHSWAHALPHPGMTLQSLLLTRGRPPFLPPDQAPLHPPASPLRPPDVPAFSGTQSPCPGLVTRIPLGSVTQGAACPLLEEAGSPLKEAVVCIQGSTPSPQATRLSRASLSSLLAALGEHRAHPPRRPSDPF